MNSNIKEQRSIAGLRANAAAFLINLSYFLPGINLIVPIVALILEGENDFVRNYAKQTLALSVVTVVALALNIVVVLGTFVFLIFTAILSIFQIIAAISALVEKEFKIPYLEKVVNLLFNRLKGLLIIIFKNKI